MFTVVKNQRFVMSLMVLLVASLIAGCAGATVPAPAAAPTATAAPTDVPIPAPATAISSTATEAAPRGSQSAPQSQPQTAPPYDWIDPNTTPPASTLYKLYDTPARGANTQGSYLIYLPPSYSTDTTRRYPVIYWLHGGFGYQTEAANIAVQPFAAAMQAGKMPETILVIPQALPSGWYANSKDGARPIEDVLIKNLVPHIDATYRTLASAGNRGIEGMSMGGYGALHLGLKYPDVFGVISSVAPAIHENLSEEPDIRTADTFFGDQVYFEANSPWGLAKSNTAAILAAKPVIRILGGSNDTGLEPALKKFDAYLTSLNISHTFSESQGAGHDYTEILAKDTSDSYAFWGAALASN